MNLTFSGLSSKVRQDPSSNSTVTVWASHLLILLIQWQQGSASGQFWLHPPIRLKVGRDEGSFPFLSFFFFFFPDQSPKKNNSTIESDRNSFGAVFTVELQDAGPHTFYRSTLISATVAIFCTLFIPESLKGMMGNVSKQDGAAVISCIFSGLTLSLLSPLLSCLWGVLLWKVKVRLCCCLLLPDVELRSEMKLSREEHRTRRLFLLYSQIKDKRLCWLCCV